jgi:hypothetical protein
MFMIALALVGVTRSNCYFSNKLMLTSLFGMVAHVLAVVLFHDQIKLRTELATHSRMKSVEGLVRQLVTDVMPDLLLFVTSIIFYVQ